MNYDNIIRAFRCRLIRFQVVPINRLQFTYTYMPTQNLSPRTAPAAVHCKCYKDDIIKYRRYYILLSPIGWVSLPIVPRTVLRGTTYTNIYLNLAPINYIVMTMMKMITLKLTRRYIITTDSVGSGQRRSQDTAVQVCRDVYSKL